MESELVTELLLPEGLPDQWKENPDFYTYLTKLGGYSVENLAKEVDRISDEKAAILNQTQQLAFENYKTFIQTAECSRQISKEFNKIETCLESLVDGLPKLSTSCEEFAEASNRIKASRRLNTLTLTRNAQLLQVLEMPQLMETCIRQGHFEEALQLSAHVRRLASKHKDIPIIVSIVGEVESCRRALRQRLLAELRTDVRLPRCLQLVGYLRRMLHTSSPPAELRLNFLMARDAWFQSLLAAIPTNDANQHLMKTLELSRINLFIIMTQYRAVFSDDDDPQALHSLSSSSSKLQSLTNAIFHNWVTEKINQFLATLEEDLSRGVGFSLGSLLGQCMYFGVSFGRVGVDFRAQIAPIFVRAIGAHFATAMRKATRKFETDMERLTLANRDYKQPANRVEGSGDQDQGPPMALLEFYPVADYCNTALTALNDLRLCAPLALASDVTRALRDSLAALANCILLFYRQEQQAFSMQEKEAFTRLCVCYADHLLPHLQTCLHAVFRPADLAKYLGTTVFKLQEQRLTYLDEADLVAPISHLLPVKVSSMQLPSMAIPKSPSPAQQSADTQPITAPESKQPTDSQPTIVKESKQTADTQPITVQESKRTADTQPIIAQESISDTPSIPPSEEIETVLPSS
ncbi:conserved oligomeric Golgi complex subunit 8 [Nilaparvata lugens]|uniref:conserved oligomeric Golgi complex subunit 8 n=1 Tax=Nilaparvata lugens TaxID=108931 RepID=UPI00193DF444|nr:conserved oligomeric Golgi complex subunit 8 [Nilaparvata lugens]